MCFINMATTRISLSSKRLPPLPSIKDIIKLYKLKALRQLSQNFLLDERLNHKIVHCAGNIQDSEVLEIGPGPGNITRAIINQAPSKIIVIEKDTRFLPTLEMLAEASEMPIQIVNADILHFNMERIFSEDKRRSWDDVSPHIHLIGNLPFNVSTPLIIKWLNCVANKSSAWSFGRVDMTLTFQKEVAERITAPVLSSQRCRLSIMCQNWCKVEHKFTIPGAAFLPKPKVDVGVVHITPSYEPVVKAPFEIFERVVRHLFNFRQKYSIKGIQTLFPTDVNEKLAIRMFATADLNPQLRPFQLTIPEIGRLVKQYQKIIEEEPVYFNISPHKFKNENEWVDKENIEEQRAREWRERNITNIDT